MDDLIPLFVKVGLTEQKAKDTVKNKKLAPTFEKVILESGSVDGCSKETGNLLYFLASKITKDAEVHLPFLSRKIASGDLKTTEQVSGKLIERKTGHTEISESDLTHLPSISCHCFRG
jgi:glutaminyl-tRNA synthetase